MTSNNQNQSEITFARMSRDGRRNADRGFAFYEDRDGRRVFVHKNNARKVAGSGDHLILTEERDQVEDFPTQIVLQVGPGREPGQHRAVKWGEDPEPHLKRYQTRWYEDHQFHDNAEDYVGGEVQVFNSCRSGRAEQYTLQSLTIEGEDAVLRMDRGRIVRDKWWNFSMPQRQPPYGRAKVQLFGTTTLKLVFYPAAERAARDW